MIRGMATMRPQVKAIGRVRCRPKSSSSRMQMLVDDLGQRSPDSVDLRKIIHARAQYALQAAELLEELAPPRGAETGDGFQRRFVVPSRAPPPVSGDREAMRLVAHALYEVQDR